MSMELTPPRLNPPLHATVNVLAPYVITGRLLDLIAKAPDGARVVNVASQVAAYSADFDNLQVHELYMRTLPILRKYVHTHIYRYIQKEREFPLHW